MKMNMTKFKGCGLDIDITDDSIEFYSTGDPSDKLDELIKALKDYGLGNMYAHEIADKAFKYKVLSCIKYSSK